MLELNGPPQQALEGLGEYLPVSRTAHSGSPQKFHIQFFIAAPKQMACTLCLLIGQRQVAVPPIAQEDSTEVLPKNLLRDVAVSAGLNDIDSQLVGSKNPKPTAPPANPPAGLVCRHYRAHAQLFHQRQVAGNAFIRQPSRRSPKASCAHLKLESHPQQVRHLMVSHPEPMLQISS